VPSVRCRRSPPGEPGTGHWSHGYHGSSCGAITPGVIGTEIPLDPQSRVLPWSIRRPAADRYGSGRSARPPWPGSRREPAQIGSARGYLAGSAWLVGAVMVQRTSGCPYVDALGALGMNVRICRIGRVLKRVGIRSARLGACLQWPTRTLARGIPETSHAVLSLLVGVGKCTTLSDGGARGERTPSRRSGNGRKLASALACAAPERSIWSPPGPAVVDRDRAGAVRKAPRGRCRIGCRPGASPFDQLPPGISCVRGEGTDPAAVPAGSPGLA